VPKQGRIDEQIARSLRALATTTGWPSELTKREIHGLWVPVSITTVAPGYRAQNAVSTSRVLTIVSSARISPASSSTHA
jgi:hypothetical protein